MEAGAERPPSARTLFSLARILATQGRDDDCERVLVGILRQEPQFIPAYSDLAELYVRRNRLAEAIRTLTSGLGRAPDDPVLLNNLGMCQVLRGDYAAAHELFSRASALAPNEHTYVANDAMALGMLGRVGEAAAAYARVLESPEEVRENLALLRQARERARVGGAGRIGPESDPVVVHGAPTPPNPPKSIPRPSMSAPAVPLHEPAAPVGPAAVAR